LAPAGSVALMVVQNPLVTGHVLWHRWVLDPSAYGVS
jgi:hypothetical protein